MARASIFVRFGLPESLWQIQLKRIRNELISLVPGDALHCWWHPHNVGFELKTGLARLTQVLDLIAEACVSNRIISMNMQDLTPMTDQVIQLRE